MKDPFHADQVLDIVLGDRVDNTVYHAQVTRSDSRQIVLHVPGYDPHHFVDLLKGTPVTLRLRWREGRYIGRTKLVRHFKNTSPYVVVARPGNIRPIKRSARAEFRRDWRIEYERIDRKILRHASADFDGSGHIELGDLPEPFDVGTRLRLRLFLGRGEKVEIEGHITRIVREHGEENRYSAAFSIDNGDRKTKDVLWRALFSPPEEHAENEDE